MNTYILHAINGLHIILGFAVFFSEVLTSRE